MRLMVRMVGWLVVVTACAGSAAEPVTNQPSVFCLDPKLDFGARYSDEVVKHAYVLTNRGPHAINILKVKGNCSCSTAEASTQVVAPGGTATVETTIKLSGMRGRQTRSIYVETDDPFAKVIPLEYTGAVIVPLLFHPEGIHFGTIGSEGRVEREVLVTAVSNEPFKVLSATTALKTLEASVETRQPGKEYAVKVACSGVRKEGSFMTQVEVATDHPRMPVISIPVAGLVAPDIIPTPGTLLVGSSVSNEVRSFGVTLWSPAGKAFRITKVGLPLETMTNTVTALMPDRYRLEVKITGSAAASDGQAIIVETDMETSISVRIPLRHIPLKAK